VKALVQRVLQGSVSIDGEVTGRIGHGMVVFVGVGREDTGNDADYLARKVAGLRIFQRDAAEFDLSVLDTGGQVLAVSQFTLMADTKKGRRPSFTDAAPPDEALPLYERFVDALRGLGVDVRTGVFQAYMEVRIHNDGPVTILVDSRNRQ
jgi:D-tyrosyl-tRNA(Tyr) deacylase